MEDSWYEKAACSRLNLPDHIFFPSRRGLGKDLEKRYVQAKFVCKSVCPVRWECLMECLELEDGVAGGTSPEERIKLRALPIQTKEAIVSYVQRNFDN